MKIVSYPLQIPKNVMMLANLGREEEHVDWHEYIRHYSNRQLSVGFGLEQQKKKYRNGSGS